METHATVQNLRPSRDLRVIIAPRLPIPRRPHCQLLSELLCQVLSRPLCRTFASLSVGSVSASGRPRLGPWPAPVAESTDPCPQRDVLVEWIGVSPQLSSTSPPPSLLCARPPALDPRPSALGTQLPAPTPGSFPVPATERPAVTESTDPCHQRDVLVEWIGVSRPAAPRLRDPTAPRHRGTAAPRPHGTATPRLRDSATPRHRNPVAPLPRDLAVPAHLGRAPSS